MRSHLARNACRTNRKPRGARQLLYPLPVTPPPPSFLCLREAHLSQQRPHLGRDRLVQDIAGRYGKRTFFGPFKRPAREVQDPQVVPGLGVLLDFTVNEGDNLRLPDVGDIQKAVKDLFQHLNYRKRLMNSTQGRCALRAVLYLQEHSPQAKGLWAGLSVANLKSILRVVASKRPREDGQYHMELATLVFNGLYPLLRSDEAQIWQRQYFVGIFNTGSSTQALGEVKRWLEGQPPSLDEYSVETLVSLLRKLSQQGDKPAMSELREILESRGLSTNHAFTDAMVPYYASLGQADEAFEWLSRLSMMPSPGSLTALVKLADHQPNLTERVNEVFRAYCDLTTPLPVMYWSPFLQWAVFMQHMDLPHLATFIQQKLAKNPELSAEDFLPGNTLDHLLMTAMERKNYVLAERITDWARKGTLGPRKLNLRVKAMQLKWRLAGNDLPGAHEAYQNIITEDAERVSSGYSQQSALNEYLRVLCLQRPPDSARLLSVLSTLEDLQVTLEPETVASLAQYLLENDLEYELIDTLSLHAMQFSLHEREVLITTMVDFCLDPLRSTARAWNTYSLLRQYFPDMEREPRVKMMRTFFSRKRPDMGVLVFGHMRGHDNPKMKPTADVYVDVLECLGRCPDLDSLKLVYNMFKMDTNIRPSTRLYNALMMAYTGCGEPFESLEFWREISNSPEGPTYESLTLYFWACEKIGPGVEKANEVWEKMSRLNVDIPLEVFSAYCAAIGSKGNLDTVKKLLLGMDGTVGYYPDSSTLRIIYDSLPNQKLQDELEQFAKASFPQPWEKLVAVIPRKKSLEFVRSKFQYSRVNDLKA